MTRDDDTAPGRDEWTGPGGSDESATTTTDPRLAALRARAEQALARGEVELMREIMSAVEYRHAEAAGSAAWRRLAEPNLWPDAWLIAAVRREAPPPAVLDVLVGRYREMLASRCRTLAPDRDQAAELAQQTWLRVLRARHLLDPENNFPGYLATIATNLWRDRHRSTRRAGPLAQHRVASLEAVMRTEAGVSVALVDLVPDPGSLPRWEHVLMKLDLEQALALLPAPLNEVIVARFVAGESCASIGVRYQRTEQAISGWVREAVREMKRLMQEPAVDRARAPCK